MHALKNIAFALTLITLPLPALAEGTQAFDIADPSQIEGLSSWGTLSGSAGAAPLSDPAFPNSLAPSGSLNWAPMESLRLELEYLYRSDSERIAPAGDATLPGSAGLMANALVNLKVSDWMTPYVGVGVGVAQLEPGFAFPGFQSSRSDALALQGIVGLSVPFSDRLSFFADGRYLRTGEFDLPLAPDLAPGDNHLQSWSATAGFRFTFGGN